jgi:hypothetical protein
MVIMSVGEAGWDRDGCSTVRRVGMRAHRRAGNPSWHFHCVRLESAATRRRKAQRARAVCGYLRDRLSRYRLPAPHDHRPPRPRDRRMRDQTRATVISASATTPAGPTRPRKTGNHIRQFEALGYTVTLARQPDYELRRRRTRSRCRAPAEVIFGSCPSPSRCRALPARAGRTIRGRWQY